jgi:hypothetical protein
LYSEITKQMLPPQCLLTKLFEDSFIARLHILKKEKKMSLQKINRK